MHVDHVIVPEADDDGTVRVFYKVPICPKPEECSETSWERACVRSYESPEVCLQKLERHLATSSLHRGMLLSEIVDIAANVEVTVEEETADDREAARELARALHKGKGCKDGGKFEKGNKHRKGNDNGGKGKRRNDAGGGRRDRNGGDDGGGRRGGDRNDGDDGGARGGRGGTRADDDRDSKRHHTMNSDEILAMALRLDRLEGTRGGDSASPGEVTLVPPAAAVVPSQRDMPCVQIPRHRLMELLESLGRAHTSVTQAQRLSVQAASKATELAVAFNNTGMAYAEEARHIESARSMLMSAISRV